MQASEEDWRFKEEVSEVEVERVVERLKIRDALLNGEFETGRILHPFPRQNWSPGNMFRESGVVFVSEIPAS